MSKGSLFWSQARGRVGDVVFSINKGQTVTRKYQAVVSNPKTNKQMLQRATFANCVKFYRRAMSAFFRFAYEDKKTKESDFNAFMRHNTSARSSWLKRTQVAGTYPAISNAFVLTDGSLNEAVIQDARGSRPYLESASLQATAGTIGEISSALMADYGLISGDIVTVVRVSSEVASLYASNPPAYPKWDVVQFTIAPSSTAPISGVASWLSLSTSLGMYLDTALKNTCYWYGVCFSRKQTNASLLVSHSELYANAVAYNLFVEAKGDVWKEIVLESWQASGDAVLEGSLVSTSQNAVITTVSGDPIPHVSSTVMNSGITSSGILVGTGLSALSISDFSGEGIIVTGLTIDSDTQATITIEGTGSAPTTWTLTYKGTVISRATSVIPVITSATPNSVSVIDTGDSGVFVIEGTNVDSISASDLVSSDEHLVINSVVASSNTRATVSYSATANVSAATIKYAGTTIFEVKEAQVTITSPATAKTLTQGSNTIALVGTDLDSLTLYSFTVDGTISLVSYTAASSTQATLTVSCGTPSTTTDYYVKYGNKELGVLNHSDEDDTHYA